ncbi:MAG: N4-gp56 family major capsid protein [Ruminococcaceae bacterium]|nr:N4-gp56 family major capsid protein [Oscillospiraceae bacterium]
MGGRARCRRDVPAPPPHRVPPRRTDRVVTCHGYRIPPPGAPRPRRRGAPHRTATKGDIPSMNDHIYDLQLFADSNVQTTGGLSAEMKTYYGMELLENARPQLVHNQFAATKPLPTGGGKTVEWRKFGSFDKALTPLTEGVTPDGSGISVSYITKELAQYGDYTTVSDMLDLTAIDDVVLEITDRHGANMGLTLDTVTRNEIQQGNQVLYAPDEEGNEITSRYDLTGACRLTSQLVARAATHLKKMNAPTIDGKYVCILHPSVAFDLRQDPDWVAAHQYAAARELFSGEIGELHGVRFVETTEAKIFRGADLASDSRTLTVKTAVNGGKTVSFEGGAPAAGALAGRYVLIGRVRSRVVSNTASAMTLEDNVTAAVGETIYPGEGGAGGCAVYGCLFLGKGAYGVVDLSEGTEVIVKPRGSSGTADPLDQRSSVGWKGVHAAAILYDEYILRVECGSSYSGQDKAN